MISYCLGKTWVISGTLHELRAFPVWLLEIGTCPVLDSFLTWMCHILGTRPPQASSVFLLCCAQSVPQTLPALVSRTHLPPLLREGSRCLPWPHQVRRPGRLQQSARMTVAFASCFPLQPLYLALWCPGNCGFKYFLYFPPFNCFRWGSESCLLLTPSFLGREMLRCFLFSLKLFLSV